MRFIAFCPNSSSTKAVSKRALLLHCYCYCATNIDYKHEVTNLQFWTLMYLIHHLGDEYIHFIYKYQL